MQNIYYQGNKKKLLPTGESSAKMESFFNCVATLMTLQLQELALVSMQDFTDLIAQPPVSKTQSYRYSFTNLFSVPSEWIIVTFTSERSESIYLDLSHLPVLEYIIIITIILVRLMESSENSHH